MNRRRKPDHPPDAAGSFFLFITVFLSAKIKRADKSRQQWWCITKGGERVNTGADAAPIADEDHFEITLETGC
nr:hypothetical protein [uncultured Oscillibacter sp.]